MPRWGGGPAPKLSMQGRDGSYYPARADEDEPAHSKRHGSWHVYYQGIDKQRTLQVNRLKAVRLIKLRFLAQMLKSKGAAKQVTVPQAPCARNLRIVMVLVLEDPVNLLLLAGPVGVLAWHAGWDTKMVFCLCFAALVPLAKTLGDATEHLVENLNQTIGGLLNATFGNAVEMLITLSAIRSGLLDVVKHSLMGSILSNLLLVLGMAFFAGGIRRQEQRFPGGAALINITMMLVGILSFCLPTVFSFSAPASTILIISRMSAIFVGIAYLAYLFFQLYTHIEVFEEPECENGEDGSGEDNESQAVLGLPWAVGLLLITTLATATLSEYMVSSIEGIVHGWKLSQAFVGVILLPIVGNACEHATAVRMAYNDKVAAAIAVAVGSSTQITLLVMPFAVLMGWLVGQPLDLNLTPSGLTVLFMAVLVVFSIVTDGRSNWLEGFMLVLSYCLVAVLYWCTSDTQLQMV